MNDMITLQIIEQAQVRIAKFIHRTPIMTSHALNDLTRTELYFKCENFQKAGAFKMRGASNAVFSLGEREAKRGVATHSSGNFAAALALAARQRGIDAHVVMPKNAPKIKVAAVRGYGAQIRFCEPTLEAREHGLEAVVAETGATFVHPFNNHSVIAGQGTAALELLDEQPYLDVIMAPVGGGGLLGGTAIAAKGRSPTIRVVAGEPAGADDAYRSLKVGHIVPQTDPQTIADGLRTSLGTLTFPILQKYVDEIIKVSEADIIRAMRLIWERMKIVIEPSSAVPFAALLGEQHTLAGKKIGLILSGGNVDLESLPWL